MSIGGPTFGIGEPKRTKIGILKSSGFVPLGAILAYLVATSATSESKCLSDSARRGDSGV